MDHNLRLRQVQAAIAERRLHALLVSHLPNIRYLCGFTGSAGVLVMTARDKILLTDSRYTEQAKQEVNGAKVKIVKKAALAAAAEWLKKHASLRRIGFESAHVTVADRASLAKGLGRSANLV